MKIEETKVSKVPFFGWDIVLIKQKDGQQGYVFTPRHICEEIGIDWGSQRRRLLKDDNFKCGLLSIDTSTQDLRGYMTTQGKSQVREMFVMPVDQMGYGLSTIQVKRCKKSVQTALIQFKKGAVAAVNKHLVGGGPVTCRSTGPTRYHHILEEGECHVSRGKRWVESRSALLS